MLATSLLVGASLGVATLLGDVAVQQAVGSTEAFNARRWRTLSSWGTWGASVAMVVAAAAFALSAWTTRTMPSAIGRGLSIGLRGAAIAVALVLFFQPALELRHETRERNRIAILVDVSRSMQLSADGHESRMKRARTMLLSSQSAIEQWKTAHFVDYFTFSDHLSPSSWSALTSDPIAANGSLTKVADALEDLAAHYPRGELAGAILLSDGGATGPLANSDTQPATTRALAESVGARVHTAWTARPGLKDVSIASVLADDFAFVRTVVPLEAIVHATGYARRTVKITLSRDGKLVQEKHVELQAKPDQTLEGRVTFEFAPPRVGKYVYQIATPLSEDEAVLTNNSRSRVIRVIRDKIRVLQIAGEPSWDVHTLRRLLKKNPNVDLISFFILRNQSDANLVPNSELSLIPFPTRELFENQLPSFDLIILQNFNYIPYGLRSYLDNIRSYVAGGGGLAMLGGSNSFSSGGYVGTPVADILPVTLLNTQNPALLLDQTAFAPKLTKAGQSHPVTSLRPAHTANMSVWRSLPPLEGSNIVSEAKRDATVLAVHPKRRTRSGARMPVMTVGPYGKGRSLAITTDSLWVWKLAAASNPKHDGADYDRFWDNTMRWLIQDPALERLHITSDAPTYQLGQPIILSMSVRDAHYVPQANVSVSLSLHRGADPSTAAAVSTYQVETDSAGQAQISIQVDTPGIYRVAARSMVATKQATAHELIIVQRGVRELANPAANDEALRQIATATGGSYLGSAQRLPTQLAFAQPRVVRVDGRTDIELWNRPALLVLALVFLGLEWLIRYRHSTSRPA